MRTSPVPYVYGLGWNDSAGRLWVAPLGTAAPDSDPPSSSWIALDSEAAGRLGMTWEEDDETVWCPTGGCDGRLWRSGNTGAYCGGPARHTYDLTDPVDFHVVTQAVPAGAWR